ncbi:TPA: type IV pili twitching motility protein PilT [Candidatus Falkowbacteria bacterium]|nr:type IV pili twitching motility protein PilT [Candidatus Falkowbacteria bacterium]
MDINNLLKLAAEKKASDIHLLFDQAPILRIDGELSDINKIVPDGAFAKLTAADLESFSQTLLSKEQRARFSDKRDLDLGYQVEAYRYRINFSFEKNNTRIVARVIDSRKPSLQEIGMPPVVEDLLNLPQGFILVTGPTGCGKSTTLAAMINYINETRGVNIITLEDPIEYIFTPAKSIISQRQLGEDMLSFAAGLKHILRQDPNVIMLGEMRDPETMAAAVTLAETGHLVFATLHTYNAAQTVDRIIDSFPPHQQNQIKSQLSGVLSAIISQRLLPRIKGGRIAAREVLINNEAIANLIREGKTAQIKSTIETNASIGMITLDRHLKELYQAGEISREVAERNMEDIGMLGA